MKSRGVGTILRLRQQWWTFFYDRLLVGFPWFWPARTTGIPAMVAVRRIVRREFGRDHNFAYRTLAKLLVAIAWPPAVVIHLWQIRQERGSGAVPIKHASGALWAAFRNNVLPGEYYAYCLWHANRKANLDNYLYAREGPRLFKLINKSFHPNPLDDKLSFYEMCKAHNVPSPEILAVYTPSGKLSEFDSKPLLGSDLFVKARLGQGSSGAELLRRQGGSFKSEHGYGIWLNDLEGYLALRARTEQRTLLLQSALLNHPALRIPTNTNLATARLVTGLSRAGEVIPIFASFIYFAVENRDRYVALINITNGQLLPPMEFFSPSKRVTTFLDFKDVRILPDWNAVLQYADTAHKACSDFIFIGWDVAFTNQGPMVLEGNTNWAADDYQRISGEPLGSTKFAEILASRFSHLERVSSQ